MKRFFIIMIQTAIIFSSFSMVTGVAAESGEKSPAVSIHLNQVAFAADGGEEIWRYRIGDTYAGHDGSHDGPISTPLMTGGRV